MPTALVLSIRPLVAASIQANLGRATHAAILAQIAAVDPAFAARLHSSEGLKPLTVSNVLGLARRGGRAQISPTQTYSLRVTLLCDTLETLARAWTVESFGKLMLDGIAWQVEQLAIDTACHPWAGHESYEALAAGALRRSGSVGNDWMFEFATPLTFRHGPMNQPLPLPDLVFGSLLDKWNAFAPLPLPSELRETIASMVVSSFDLHSVVVPTKGGALQIGGVGRCSYRALGGTSDWLAGIDLLARFAFYSGVGAGTGRGFGQTRLLPAAPDRHRAPAPHAGVAEDPQERASAG
ncbi:MAG: CRISPR system precrRNA processing endoribonuclease RAMP protein Cas6 [Chloroflexota bacterium]|nr:CRISPR system precrRNA processing endoribonuclease RAMP protein Cas6 [Chloroflexota bacterium]